MIKGGSLAEPRIVKVDNSVLFIKSTEGDYDEISFQEIKLSKQDTPKLKKKQSAKWDSSLETWISTEPLVIIPPSPNDLGAKKRFYIYSDFQQLLRIYSANQNNQIAKAAILERIIFIPLFAFYFFIACINVIRCRHIKLVWVFPIFSLMALTVSIMGFKTLCLEYGLAVSGSFVLVCAISTPNLFNLYFRRKHTRRIEN
jgi:hypothetical protein